MFPCMDISQFVYSALGCYKHSYPSLFSVLSSGNAGSDFKSNKYLSENSIKGTELVDLDSGADHSTHQLQCEA